MTLSLFTSKIAVKLYKIIIASVVNSFLSVFIMFSKFYIVPAKFAVIFLIAIILFKGSYKLKIKFVCVYYLYSYMLAGIVLSINTITETITINGVNYSYVSGAGVLLSVAVMLLLILIIRKFLSRQLKNPGNYKAVTIFYSSTTINLIGFCDSGNTMYDYENMCPIFVATSGILSKIPDIEYTKTMECRTVSGIGKIKVFKPDNIMVESRSIQAMIGISDFEFNNDYDLLLTEDIFTDNLNSKNTETENLYV